MTGTKKATPAIRTRARRRRRRRLAIVLGLVMLIAVGWPFGQMLWVWGTGLDPQSPGVEADGLDAIVVFGAAAYPNRLSVPLEDRMSAALALYRALAARGRQVTVLVSGGQGRGPRDPHEAEAMARWARAHGLPDGALLIDRDGATTRHTARAVARLAAERRWRQVAIVTHVWHQPRARLAIQAAAGERGLALATIPASPRHARYTGALGSAARELLAYWAYACGWEGGRATAALSP